MKVIIYDYSGEPQEIEITKEVSSAVILMLSGDQVLYVKYKDDTDDYFDSSSCRSESFFDEAQFVDLYDGIDCKKYRAWYQEKEETTKGE